MRYHTILMILAKEKQDEIEFHKILHNYLDGLDNSGLSEIHKQELLIFICNTLLWLQEYSLAYELLKTAKSFIKNYPNRGESEKAMHYFGINTVFVKTTFTLAWIANGDSKTDDFKLSDSDFEDITGLLYNNYIKIMYFVNCIVTENGMIKKKLLFSELKSLIDITNYSKIYDILNDLDSDFSRYFY